MSYGAGFQNEYDYEQYTLKQSKWRSDQGFRLLMLTIKSKCVGKTLDVGCGRGEFVFDYGDAVGIDLKRFDEWGNDPRFRVRAFEKVDLKGFNTVLFNNSFEHIKNKKLVLYRCKGFNTVFVLPTEKHLLKCWSRLPGALVNKLFGKPHEDIRYLLVHSFNVYGFNFIKTYLDFNSWHKLLMKNFGKVVIDYVGDYAIAVCR